MNEKILSALTGSKDFQQAATNLLSKRLALAAVIVYFLIEAASGAKSDAVAIAALSGLVLTGIVYMVCESWGVAAQAEATAVAVQAEASRTINLVAAPPAPPTP